MRREAWGVGRGCGGYVVSLRKWTEAVREGLPGIVAWESTHSGSNNLTRREHNFQAAMCSPMVAIRCVADAPVHGVPENRATAEVWDVAVPTQL